MPLREHFSLTDRDSCEAAMRRGGVASLVSAAAHTFLAGTLTDPWEAAGATLSYVLAFFIFRKSRAAATLMVTKFVLGKCWSWAETGIPPAFLLSIVMCLYLLTAARAAFQWHAEHTGTLSVNPTGEVA